MPAGRGDSGAGEEDMRRTHGAGGDVALKLLHVADVIGQRDDGRDAEGQIGLEIVDQARRRVLVRSRRAAGGRAEVNVRVDQPGHDVKAGEIGHRDVRGDAGQARGRR